MIMKYGLLGAFLVIGTFPVFAQGGALGSNASDVTSLPENTNQIPGAPVSENMAVASASGDIEPISIPSLLFNYWEQTAIIEAKKSAKSGGVMRGVTQDEINRAMDEPMDQERVKPPPEERVITLGGILYTSADDWTIWLNGERVTPDALPKEIIDLRVYKHHIDMKWQDEYTRRLYPIRLRAHQRFHLDTRIFLPG